MISKQCLLYTILPGIQGPHMMEHGCKAAASWNSFLLTKSAHYIESMCKPEFSFVASHLKWLLSC
uniref:Uncharacterized protein n=1 Tax=Hordeum vulgare subsp. vulgare TaxID=112509 RepID=A0A8I6WGL4_HORVV